MEHTLVFYESTHRILDCLDDIATVFSESCPIVLVKELTKTFEHFISDSCKEVKDWLLVDNHTKGEFVLIIPPRHIDKQTDSDKNILSILLSELPLKQAVKLASQITPTPKNELYQMALKLHEIKDT
jgi:16S rRNA (cytidine1402-2'-O)-methyltransferase